MLIKCCIKNFENALTTKPRRRVDQNSKKKLEFSDLMKTSRLGLILKLCDQVSTRKNMTTNCIYRKYYFLTL